MTVVWRHKERAAPLLARRPDLLRGSESDSGGRRDVQRCRVVRLLDGLRHDHAREGDRGALGRGDLLHQSEDAVIDGGVAASAEALGRRVRHHLEAVVHDAREADVDVVVRLDDVLPQRFVIVTRVLERDVLTTEQFVHLLEHGLAHRRNLGRDGGGTRGDVHRGTDAGEPGGGGLLLANLPRHGPVVDVGRDPLGVAEVRLRPLVVLAVVFRVRLHRCVDQQQLRGHETARDDVHVALLRGDAVDSVERGGRLVELRLFLLVDARHEADAGAEAERVHDHGERLDHRAATVSATEDAVVDGGVVGGDGGSVGLLRGDGTDELRVGLVHNA